MIQIFSTFEHSIHLELAISSLEQHGVEKKSIFAVPLTTRKTNPNIFDSIHNADGISLVSTGAALGTALAVIGASVGFRLEWGPIYWGIIGAGSGFLLGFLIDLLYYKVLRKGSIFGRKKTEVLLIVECEEARGDLVEDILWHHSALGTARVN